MFDKIEFEISKIYHFKYKIINFNTIKEEKNIRHSGTEPGRLGTSLPLR